MKYLAVLGRLPKISLAELEAQFGDSVRQIAPSLAVFSSDTRPDINHFGGVLKFAELITQDKASLQEIIDCIKKAAPTGKIVLGVSDYSKHSSSASSSREAMRFKKILSRTGRSVRVLSNRSAFGALSTATVHHNQLGEKSGHIELIKVGKEWYLGLGVQNITAYAKRDQARPARDAKVGMLPPKLAQILINLCGPLSSENKHPVLLDPFCGTGVLLQEAVLMGYSPLGSDLSDRMVEYTQKNLKWLLDGNFSINFPGISSRAQKLHSHLDPKKQIFQGDACDTTWPEGISAVACETYLGSPMSQPPVEIKLKTEKQNCKETILGFLKNIHPQLAKGTPLALAVPAWLRPDGSYNRLNILDEIAGVGYNVTKFRSLSQNDLLYYREGQVVAREIIVLKVK